MSRLQTAVLLVGLSLLSCKPDVQPTQRQPIEPPVTSFESIPNAPVNGMIRGAPFEIRDARYVTDHRAGYLRTDIQLSAGKADAACGETKPPNSPSLWIRLEGTDKVESQEFKLTPGQESKWSVHYQVRTDTGWVGNTDASAVVSIRTEGPDRTLAGGVAVCFADGEKSCVSGSFEAKPCPYRIDAPVRGALPVESIPEKYRAKLQAVTVPSATPSATPSAAPSATPSAAPSVAPSASAAVPVKSH